MHARRPDPASLAADRRRWLAAALAAPWLPPAWAAADGVADATSEVAARLREGGVVIAFRHARAPGTFDPPGFRLGDCRTQRNLDDEGRAQARRIGAWFDTRGLKPARLRSSPWCRCLETATLAFGRPETWPALGSPHGASESTSAAALAELRRALVAVKSQPGRFEVWVTHMFVLSALTGENSASGEGLLLRADAGGAPRVLARLPIA